MHVAEILRHGGGLDADRRTGRCAGRHGVGRRGVDLGDGTDLHDHIPRAGFAPAPLLEHLVTAGYLGRKIGRGFRDYS